MSPVAESLLWLTPAPLWQRPSTGVDEPGFSRPWLAEFGSDLFVEDFLDLLGSSAGAGPAALGDLAPDDGAGTAVAPYVLYQPVHGRFYLVVGSLVCRRVGLPDREVRPKGQRVSFVVRRLVAGTQEQAWLPAGRSGRWVDVASPQQLFAGEEQLPMHAAPLGAPAGDDLTAHLLGLDEPGRRTVHFGYVPVAKRTVSAEPLADPVVALAGSAGRLPADDARLMEFRLHVAGPWSDLAKLKSTLPLPGGLEDVSVPSLYVLLDLRDWLATWLPGVLAALLSNTPMSSAPKGEALRVHLNKVIVKRTGEPDIPLRRALADLETFKDLVHGADIDGPGSKYDVSRVLVDLGNGFFSVLNGDGSGGGLVLDALTAGEAANQAKPEEVPPELADMVVARTDPKDPKSAPDVHVLRLVYEHEPCAPVLSQPSGTLRFATTFDPDAPARHVRIEMPDPAHLRRFKRGVAIDMPPNLRKILDRVRPEMLEGDGLGSPGGGWELGMICSFSIHIIFMIAFVIMFIFAILLNIVFWWMAFLKICFPVPKKK